MPLPPFDATSALTGCITIVLEISAGGATEYNVGKQSLLRLYHAVERPMKSSGIVGLIN